MLVFLDHIKLNWLIDTSFQNIYLCKTDFHLSKATFQISHAFKTLCVCRCYNSVGVISKKNKVLKILRSIPNEASVVMSKEMKQKKAFICNTHITVQQNLFSSYIQFLEVDVRAQGAVISLCSDRSHFKNK